MRLHSHRAIPMVLLFVTLTHSLRCRQATINHAGIHSFPLNASAVLYPTGNTFIPDKSTHTDPGKIKRKKAGLPHVTFLKYSNSIACTFKRMVTDSPGIIFSGKNGYPKPRAAQVTEHALFQKSSALVLSGLPQYRYPGPYAIAELSRQQGLRSNTINCIIEDRRQHLWIGTASGAASYDGHNILNLTTASGLCHNDVRTILQDKKGYIWFGTAGGGVSKYDGRSFVDLNEDNGLSSNTVLAMTEDKDGNIWMGTSDGGINKYDGSSITSYKKENGLAGNRISAIICDQAGQLWIGTENGISAFDGKRFINYKFPPSDNSIIQVLMLDSKNRLWIGTDHGLYFFDGHYLFSSSTPDNLGIQNILSLMEDREQNIWIGTQNGLYVYDGHSLSPFGKDEDLNHTPVYSLYQRHTGSIWMGTASEGLLKYDPHTFYHVMKDENRNKDYVLSVFQDAANNVWFGSRHGGMSQLSGDTIKNFTMAQGLPDNDVRYMTQDRQGHYWIATPQGVTKFDGQSFEYYTTLNGLADNHVNQISCDSRNNIWIATEHGASRFDGRSFANFFCGSLSLNITTIMEDSKSNIWFGTESGIFCFDGAQMFQLGDTSGTLSENIQDIYQDKNGIIWFGTTSGLLRYDGINIVKITEKEGLINDDISAIKADKTGNIWIGTRFGLSKLSLKHLTVLSSRIRNNGINAEDIFFRNYDYNDGFPGTGVNTSAMAMLTNGSMIAGTPQGLTRFDPDVEAINTRPPHVEITTLKMANQIVDWNNLDGKSDTTLYLAEGVRLHAFRFDSITPWSQVPSGLNLPTDNNYLSISFSAPMPDHPQDVIYSYQLDGANNNARTYTKQPFAVYGNLAPRQYTFRVKAGTSHGIWGKETKFSFTIRPPWWQTWWFELTVMLVFGYVIFSSTRMLFRFRMQKQKNILEKQLALQYERQRISADLHDDIGATLSSINIYCNLAQTEKNKDEYLKSIRTNVIEVIEKLDDLVWRINPKYDTVESVISRLVFYANPAAVAKQMAFNIDLPENLPSIKLDSEIKQHVFLIIKELLNNAIKYSQGKNLWLTVAAHEAQLEIMVRDDGIGMDLNYHPGQRNGLTNIQSRADKINGRLIMKSEMGKGLFICLIVPLKSHKYVR